jgi:hypothetical protein
VEEHDDVEGDSIMSDDKTDATENEPFDQTNGTVDGLHGDDGGTVDGLGGDGAGDIDEAGRPADGGGVLGAAVRDLTDPGPDDDSGLTPEDRDEANTPYSEEGRL